MPTFFGIQLGESVKDVFGFWMWVTCVTAIILRLPNTPTWKIFE